MKKSKGPSDQLRKGSARYDEGIYGQAAQAASGSCQTAWIDRAESAARLCDRALQEVWQAWVQVCPGAGSWTEVLSVSEPGRAATGDGVCSQGVCGGGGAQAGEPAGVSQGTGGTLRDKQGAAEAARRVLAGRDECQRQAGSVGQYRRGPSGSGGCQYAGGSSQRGLF